jgi:hypothetical protein
MVWAWLIIPLVVTLFIGYTISSSNLGLEAAWRNILGTALFLLVIFGIVLSLFFLPSPWGEYILSAILFIFSAMSWLNILTAGLRKRQAGFLLWNLGWPSTHKYLLVASFLFFISAILQTLVFFSLGNKSLSGSTTVPEYSISQIVLYWSVAIYLWWAGLSKLELREKGIYFKFGLIKWDKITHYRWEGASGTTLTVWLKQRIPLFPARSWTVPLALKNAVDRVIFQHTLSKY